MSNLVWLDLEMSGLSPASDKVLEIATVVTDSQLTILAEGPIHAIKQPEDILANMNDWCRNQHGKSGLTERVRNSQITEAVAEEETLAFLKEYVQPNESPLCGNTVHQDRFFLNFHMPELAQFFHYRNLDVSSFKIAAHLWKPQLLEHINKSDTHLALADVLDSIEEMRVYKKYLFG